MSLAHSPSVVRNGLVVHLDAANIKSYSGTGTTWYDLSGNGNNGTLINGTGYDAGDQKGCMVFDGVNNYVQFTPVACRTAIVFAKANAGATNGLQCLLGATAGGDGALRFEGGTFRNSSRVDANDFQQLYPQDLWINGVKNPGNNDASGYYTVPNGRSLAAPFFVSCKMDRSVSTVSHTFMGRVLSGRVYAVLLYNRFLTDLEIKQNFEALRGRYGI